jgi:hypothetical protein
MILHIMVIASPGLDVFERDRSPCRDRRVFNLDFPDKAGYRSEGFD